MWRRPCTKRHTTDKKGESAMKASWRRETRDEKTVSVEVNGSAHTVTSQCSSSFYTRLGRGV